MLSPKELKEYEIEKPTQQVLIKPEEIEKPTQQVLIKPEEIEKPTQQVLIKPEENKEQPRSLLKPVTEPKAVATTPLESTPVETEEEPVVRTQAPTPLERAQNTINDCTPSIGLSLSSARRARGFDLLTVADQTRIPKSIIEVIEQSNFEKAPAPVYTRAYIKKLAEFYAIDTQVLVDQYNKMLEMQRRCTPVKTSHSNSKKKETASSVNLKPVITKTQGNEKLLKKITFIIAFVLITWLIVDCTGGKKSDVKKTVKPTTTVKTTPAIKLKDLTRYSRPTKLEVIKLDVPKNKIK